MMTSLETKYTCREVELRILILTRQNSLTFVRLFIFKQTSFSTQGNQHPVILQVNDKRNEMTHLSVVSGLTVIK